MKEVKSGVGSNLRGEVSLVSSEYDLEGEVLVAVIDADIVKQTKKKLTVSTKYTDSCSFKIVTEDDTYVFVHRRTVTDKPGIVPNQIEPTKRPEYVVQDVDTPSLVEINNHGPEVLRRVK